MLFVTSTADNIYAKAANYKEVSIVFNKLKNIWKRAAAASMAAVFSVGLLNVRPYAQTAESTAVQSIALSSSSGSSYSEYISQYADASRTVVSVYADTASYSTSLGAQCDLLSDYEGMPNVLHWKSGGAVTLPIEVSATGLYDLELIYRTPASETTQLSLGVLIDYELPFDEAAKISLDRYWQNKTGNIQYDSTHKNQIRPTQVLCDDWVTYTLLDKSSFSAEVFSFYLTEGEHTVTLQNSTAELYLGRINFTNTSKPKAYSEVRPSEEEIQNTPALSNGEAILVEAEVPTYTNSSALQATREPSEYLASPAHPTGLRFNTIGGTLDSDSNAWDTPSQKAVYEVTVPSDGYYTLNLRCRRNSDNGFASYRKITVNGAVPCREFASIRIDNSAFWQTVNLSDSNGNPIYVYLKNGANTIAIEAVTGDCETIAQSAEQIADSLYQSITSGPVTIEDVQNAVAEFNSQNDNIYDTYGTKMSEISDLTLKLSAALKTAQKRSIDIADILDAQDSQVQTSITQLICALRNLHSQPLELDYFEVKTVHEEFRSTRVNIFKAIVFAFRSFIGSFFSDLQSEPHSIDVWVCLDRKQTEIVNRIVEKQYNATHDLKINIKSDNGNLSNAVAAGKGPDAALYADADLICSLWEQGVTVNIHETQDFAEVYERFPEGLSGMYSHDGEVHAVPLTNSFPMMFCRTDILDKLGLTVPETWDEFAEALEILSENGYDTAIVSSENAEGGFNDGDIFLSMITQTDEKSLDSESAAAAFEKWAQLCGNYDFCDDDLFTSFRTGISPIVIADFMTFSARLSDEAYELSGLWSPEHIPGTYRTIDGLRNLDCSVNTTSLGAVILDKCENTSAAWEFISWFSSDEIQEQIMNAFGAECYSPANLNVSSHQSWTELEYREIITQRDSTLELHNVSASEEVVNAVYSALERTLQGENARDAYLDELSHHNLVSSNQSDSQEG